MIINKDFCSVARIAVKLRIESIAYALTGLKFESLHRTQGYALG
jgi:hypothetical protein